MGGRSTRPTVCSVLSLPDPDHGLVADLVLEGGGVLGVAHVGALEVLDRAGYRFARVAGSSVGALVGALVAGGLSVARISEVLSELDFTSLTDRSPIDRIPILGPLASIVLDNGVYEGDSSTAWWPTCSARNAVWRPSAICASMGLSTSRPSSATGSS